MATCTITETVDLRDAQPEDAACMTHAVLQRIAAETGYNPEHVRLLSPSESEVYIGPGKVWRVVWEGGPYEWAVNLTLGQSLFAGETNRYDGRPEIVLTCARHYLAEPHYSFDIGFFPEG